MCGFSQSGVAWAVLVLWLGVLWLGAKVELAYRHAAATEEEGGGAAAATWPAYHYHHGQAGEDDGLGAGGGEEEAGGRRHHRLLWPDNRMPVRLAQQGFSEAERAVIREAMARLSALTNLRVVEEAEGEGGQQHPVLVEPSPWPCRCESARGRQPFSDLQLLRLGPGCVTVAMVLHELMHSAGLGHVHQRPDAPQHVRLTRPLHLLSPALHAALAPDTRPDPLWPPHGYPSGFPYDVRSIMHYSSRAFTHDAICRIDEAAAVDSGTSSQAATGNSTEPGEQALLSSVLRAPLLVRVDGSWIDYNTDLSPTDIAMVNALYPKDHQHHRYSRH